MSEYLVTFKATIPTWFGFSSQSRDEAKVFEGKTAQEATAKAEAYCKDELSKAGISEYDLKEHGISVSIVDVKKI